MLRSNVIRISNVPFDEKIHYNNYNSNPSPNHIPCDISENNQFCENAYNLNAEVTGDVLKDCVNTDK